LSDFTTASKTAFQHEKVRFIAINVAELDAFKQGALPLVGDARAVLTELLSLTAGYHVDADYTDTIARLQAEWQAEVQRVCQSAIANQSAIRNPQSALAQSQVIGVLQETLAPTDVIVCAAGSLPGDLHKLWRARDSKGYHMEYGYSCMGYEIAGGLGVKMAAPEREVYVLVGDGSYLMMAQEIVTAVQEHIKIIIVLFDNHGFASIGGLSESVGSGGFGTRYRYRDPRTGELDGDVLAVDFAANAASLGARALRAGTLDELRDALAAAKRETRTAVIVVPVDREARVGGYESWWDVPVAEVSSTREVQSARARWEDARRKEREFL
jgi:3D-(3,5/4)-trihydroxycyclohexane-1,2-dione acylhydrolase (decyclizing)